jgi:hypothetical protein
MMDSPMKKMMLMAYENAVAPARMMPTAPMVVLLACVAVYLVHMMHKVMTMSKYSRSEPAPAYTLYLRKLSISGAAMLVGNETESAMLDEYNLLTDLLFPKLDFCVMKALAGDLPVLSQQERLHAKMHIEAQAERNRLQQGMGRWGWLMFLVDLFLLRLGKEIGCTCAGYVEATSGVWFYLRMILPFTKGFMSHEYAYHSMEELEHGPLTTQYLRAKVSIMSTLLLLPVMAFVYLIYSFLTPPIMAL